MVYPILHPILQRLGPRHLKTFKQHIGNHQQIPSSHLRSAGAHDTVHLMMQHHGHEDALKISFNALKKMNKWGLVRDLKELVREGAEDIAEHVVNPILEDDDDGEDDDEEEVEEGEGEGEDDE